MTEMSRILDHNAIAKVLRFATEQATYSRAILAYESNRGDALDPREKLTHLYWDLCNSTFTEAVFAIHSLLSEESDIIAFQNLKDFSKHSDLMTELQSMRELYGQSSLRGIRDKLLGHITMSEEYNWSPSWREGMIGGHLVNSLTNILEGLSLTFLEYAKRVDAPYSPDYFDVAKSEIESNVSKILSVLIPI
jgi:hypothetical protein